MPGWASWLLAAAGDHLGAQRRHGVVVQRAAEGARRVHVDVGGDQRGGVGDQVDLRVVGARPGQRASG